MNQISIKSAALFILMALFLCFEMAIQVSTGIMTSELKSSIGLGTFSIGIMSGAYFITYTIMQIPSGLMYDRINFFLLTSIAIAICSLGICCLGFSQGILSASFSRLLMGFGSAFAFISVLTVATQYFPPVYFAFLTGVAQLLAALGGIIGNYPLAWLVSKYGWRNTSFILSILGLIITLFVLLFLKFDNSTKDKTLDESTSESIYKSLTLIIKDRRNLFAAMYAFFNWAPVTAFASLWGVPFLKTSYGFSTTTAGSLCSLIWLGIGVSSPIIGIISDVMQRRTIPMFFASAIGFVGAISVIYIPNLRMPMLSVLLFMCGIGSAGQILSFAIVKDCVSKSRISTAIGINNMAVVASGILVQPIIGLLLSGNDDYLTINDFRVALVILPISFIICICISLFFLEETFCGKRN